MVGRMRSASGWLAVLCGTLCAASCGGSPAEQQEDPVTTTCSVGQIVPCTCMDGTMSMSGCLPGGMPAPCACAASAGQGGVGGAAGVAAAGSGGGMSSSGTGGMIAGGTGGMTAGGTSGMTAGGSGGMTAGGTGGMTAGGAGGSTTPPPPGTWAAADPGGMGPFATVNENNVGPDSSYTMFRPMDLAMSGNLHPVITWGNGTGTMPSTYSRLLTQLASHGFIVIASNSTNVAQGTPPPMLNGVTWVFEQNEASGSPLYQHVDTARVGATGHSQGAFASSSAGADERIKAIAPLQGARSGTLHGPALLLCGGMDTTVPCSGSQSAFDRITVPVMYANLKAATHTNWISSGFGGGMPSPYFRAVVAWMRVHLMDDAALRPMFYGASCELCGDSQWEIMQKMLD
jgi:hypothetical protein